MASYSYSFDDPYNPKAVTVTPDGGEPFKSHVDDLPDEHYARAMDALDKAGQPLVDAMGAVRSGVRSGVDAINDRYESMRQEAAPLVRPLAKAAGTMAAPLEQPVAAMGRARDAVTGYLRSETDTRWTPGYQPPETPAERRSRTYEPEADFGRARTAEGREYVYEYDPGPELRHGETRRYDATGDAYDRAEQRPGEAVVYSQDLGKYAPEARTPDDQLVGRLGEWGADYVQRQRRADEIDRELDRMGPPAAPAPAPQRAGRPVTREELEAAAARAPTARELAARALPQRPQEAAPQPAPTRDTYGLVAPAAAPSRVTAQSEGMVRRPDGSVTRTTSQTRRLDDATRAGDAALRESAPATEGVRREALPPDVQKLLQERGLRVVPDTPEPQTTQPDGPTGGLYNRAAPGMAALAARRRDGATAAGEKSVATFMDDPSNAPREAPRAVADVQASTAGPMMSVAPPAEAAPAPAEPNASAAPPRVNARDWKRDKAAEGQQPGGSPRVGIPEGSPLGGRAETWHGKESQVWENLYENELNKRPYYVAGTPEHDQLGAFQVQRSTQGGIAEGSPIQRDEAMYLANTGAKAEDAERQYRFAQEDEQRDRDTARAVAGTRAELDKAYVDKAMADQEAAISAVEMEKLAEINAQRAKGYWEGTDSGEKALDIIGAVFTGLVMPWAIPSLIDNIANKPDAKAKKERDHLAQWKDEVTKGTRAQLNPAAQDIAIRLAGTNHALAEVDRLAATAPNNPVAQKRAAASRAALNATRARLNAQFRGVIGGQETVQRSEHWQHIPARAGGMAGGPNPERLAKYARNAAESAGRGAEGVDKSMTARAGAAGTVAHAQAEAEKAATGGKPPVEVTGPDGRVYRFRPGAPEKAVTDTVSSMMSLNGITRNTQMLIEQQESMGANTIDKATANLLVTGVAAQTNSALGQGAMGDQERTNMVNSLTGMNTAEARKKLPEMMMNIVRGNMATVIQGSVENGKVIPFTGSPTASPGKKGK